MPGEIFQKSLLAAVHSDFDMFVGLGRMDGDILANQIAIFRQAGHRPVPFVFIGAAGHQQTPPYPAFQPGVMLGFFQEPKDVFCIHDGTPKSCPGRHNLHSVAECTLKKDPDERGIPRGIRSPR